MPEPPQAPLVLAVDPGTHKCGVAVVDAGRGVLARQVVDAADLLDAVRRLLADHPVTHLVVGDRTGSRRARALLAEVAGDRPVILVAEHLTSLDARRRYFRENPPRGLRRLVPPGLRVPPGPIDDYVAVILAERYLSG
ncbi:MAG: Holliday junction resolvase RuvX [Armatimonadetes bacterium]|nr:Holliday junction resolvase RuvX [Armatimonadota bacterium]